MKKKTKDTSLITYICYLCGTDLVVYDKDGVISVNPCQICRDESYNDGASTGYDNGYDDGVGVGFADGYENGKESN